MDVASPRSDRIAVWDVVSVDYPFADQARARRRPVLVAAIPDVHAEFEVLWVVMITSEPRGEWPLDVPVSDLASGDLDRACVVRTSKITTIDARLAVRIGKLSEA